MKNSAKNDYNDEIRSYFKSIKDFKPLTKEQEKELFDKYNKGDITARNKIIEANLKYVIKMAKRYKGYGIPFADLISEGNVGLMKAINKFDVKNDVKFYCYGKWWIQATMQEFIKKRIESDTNELCHDEVSEKKNNSFTINETSENNDDEETIGTENVTTEESREINNEILTSLIKTLNSSEKEIIEYYYGLKDGNPLTLDEIGKKFNLTSERVRQKKENILRKLRSFAIANCDLTNIYI